MGGVVIPAPGQEPPIVCGFCGARVEAVDEFRRCGDCKARAHGAGRYRPRETVIDFDPFNYERRGG